MSQPEWIELAPEERLYWHFARTWRQPTPLAGVELDWTKVVEMARWNRVESWLYRALEGSGMLAQMPASSCQDLESAMAEQAETAVMLRQALQGYLHAAARADVHTVAMKGVALSTQIYGDETMRPGSDIDLLVHRRDVEACLEVLEGLGYGRWWPKLMADRYYARHHLHQLRCDPDIKIWIEVHWTLDHPYTLLTMDIDGVMDRTRQGELFDEPIRELSWADLLLSLSVHLVKHAVYLPNVMERSDLARVILADGMLTYYIDVAEAIKGGGERTDWEQLVELARQWGAASIMGAVLRVCRWFLDAPVPDDVLAALPVQSAAGLRGAAMRKMADYEVHKYLGKPPSRFWDFMLMTNDAFILRPIRLLDTITYFFPDEDYLRRRYGGAKWTTRLAHIGRAFVDYAVLGVESLYYSCKRWRRIARHERDGVLVD